MVDQKQDTPDPETSTPDVGAADDGAPAPWDAGTAGDVIADDPDTVDATIAKAAAPRGPLVEGGRGAVVIGATFDGLVAAATLARAGVDVVLLENGEGMGGDSRRVVAEGYRQDLEDAALRRLDPAVVKGLALGRRGFSYTDRRLDTVYAFADGGLWCLRGDLASLADVEPSGLEDAPPIGEPSAADRSRVPGPEDRRRTSAVMERALDAARALAPVFRGDPDAASQLKETPTIRALMTGSLRGFLDHEGVATPFSDVLAVEATLECPVRPDAPLSAGGLALRLAGESLGRATALSFPTGGMRGTHDALRRAAQAAGVDIRRGPAVRRVLIERDRVEGVALADGGQIRASIVVDAGAAREAFLDRIGRDAVDVDLGRRFDRPPPQFGFARIAVAFGAEASAAISGFDPGHRYVVVPTLRMLTDAFSGEGMDLPGPRAAEAIFTHRRIAGAVPTGGFAAILRLAPFRAPTAEPRGAPALASTWRGLAEASARDVLRRIDPALERAMLAFDADWAPAPEPPARAFGLRRAATDGAGIDGYFFCGPEAQVGAGPSGGAGARAAALAMALVRERRS